MQILDELCNRQSSLSRGRIMTADTATSDASNLTGSGQTGTTQNGGGGAIPHVPAGPGTASGSMPTDGTQSENTPPLGTLARLARTFRRGPTTTLGADDCLTYDQLKDLRERVRSNDNATDEVAEELSAALRQAERIRSQDLYIVGAYDQLTFIVDCLLATKPQLILARDGRLSLQLEIYRRAGWISRTLATISSGSPVGLVLSALVIAFVLWSVFMGALQFISHNTFISRSNAIPTDIFFMDGRALAIITSAALIGGIVSIATRLNEFSRVRDLDPFAMFWTAMLKPLIGVVLAVFILATLEGNILSFGFLPAASLAALSKTPLTDPAFQALYILWVLGFLAGFSERFAWDFVGRAQGVASGSPGGDKK